MMRKPTMTLSLVALFFFGFDNGVVLASSNDVLPASKRDASIRVSLTEEYNLALANYKPYSNDFANKVATEVDEGHYSAACALHLAAATAPLSRALFLSAQQELEAALALAPKLSTADRKQLIVLLESMLKNLDLPKWALPDSNIKRFLAEQILAVFNTLPQSKAAERADVTIRLAADYCNLKSFRKAELLLLDLLEELEKGSSSKLKIGEALIMLAIVYENEGSLEFASQCREYHVQFLRAYAPAEYGRAMEQYVDYLLWYHKTHEAVQKADVLARYLQEKRLAQPDAVAWELLASKLIDVDLNESNVLFKIGLELALKKFDSREITFCAPIAWKWAKSLKKQGNAKDAIQVLKSALKHTQDAKDKTGVAMRERLVRDCVDYLKEDNRGAESFALLENFRKEKNDCEIWQTEEENREFQKVMSDPSPDSNRAKIYLLMSKASSKFEKEQCDDALALLDRAIELYKQNASRDPEGNLYYHFIDIERRLNRCGRSDAGIERLWKLVELRMRDGISETRSFFSFHGGASTANLPELELVTWINSLPSETLKKQNREKFLLMAKKSGRAANLIYAWQHDIQEDPKPSRLAVCQETELWREQCKVPDKLLQAMFQTASEYVNLDQFDKGNEKWKAALCIDIYANGSRFSGPSPAPGLLNQLGNAFMKKNRLTDAGVLFLEAYKHSFQTAGETDHDEILHSIKELAAKYISANDYRSAIDLFRQAELIVKGKGSSGSLALCEIYLNLAGIATGVNDLKESSAAFNDFLLVENRAEVRGTQGLANLIAQYASVFSQLGKECQAANIRSHIAPIPENNGSSSLEGALSQPTPSPKIVLSKLHIPHN